MQYKMRQNFLISMTQMLQNLKCFQFILLVVSNNYIKQCIANYLLLLKLSYLILMKSQVRNYFSHFQTRKQETFERLNNFSRIYGKKQIIIALLPKLDAFKHIFLQFIIYNNKFDHIHLYYEFLTLSTSHEPFSSSQQVLLHQDTFDRHQLVGNLIKKLQTTTNL